MIYKKPSCQPDLADAQNTTVAIRTTVVLIRILIRYVHDRRADKDSYPHDSNNQCIILRLQLSFVMINVQLMLV